VGGQANQIVESTGSAGWCVSAAAARRQPVAGWRVQVTMMAMMEQPWRPMLANYLLMNYSFFLGTADELFLQCYFTLGYCLDLCFECYQLIWHDVGLVCFFQFQFSVSVICPVTSHV